MLMFSAGPWKGGRGAGRARRGLSVITGLKNDVNVNLSGYCRSLVKRGKEPQLPVFKRFISII